MLNVKPSVSPLKQAISNIVGTRPNARSGTFPSKTQLM
jgi:hypothetical protein